jgi:hypothetical protein
MHDLGQRMLLPQNMVFWDAAVFPRIRVRCSWGTSVLAGMWKKGYYLNFGAPVKPAESSE